MLPGRRWDAAVLRVVRTGLGASVDEIAAVVPHLMELKVVSTQLRQVVHASVVRLETDGAIAREGALFVVASAVGPEKQDGSPQAVAQPRQRFDPVPTFRPMKARHAFVGVVASGSLHPCPASASCTLPTCTSTAR